MKLLIKNVKVSKTDVVVGENIRIDVETANPAVEVAVNNVAGSTHYLQFATAGTHTVVITACFKKKMEQATRVVKVGDTTAGQLVTPVIGSGLDRYHPRTIVFSILNANQLGDVRRFEWDFGDGSSGTSDGTSITHDYSETLDPNKLVTSFHVRAKAIHADQTTIEATRTIAVFCLYGYNKIRHSILTPRVDVLEPITLPYFGVMCMFIVHNPEDEELSFSAEKHEWLTTQEDEPRFIDGLQPGNLARGVAERLATNRSQIPAMHLAKIESQFAAKVAVNHEPPMDLRIPPRSTLTVVRLFQPSEFKKPIFGVAVHLRGNSMCSKLPVLASA
jgi:hypothetical protein